ncbi:phage shock protein PspC (stress-responsive transcriptional regulator) [Glaciihabitans sp. GrIS 2.15]|nr:phage shock protein PspC (stress-responsive transcriptional regulator) [Glaciihabitans sp. GrIS 2.15]
MAVHEPIRSPTFSVARDNHIASLGNSGQDGLMAVLQRPKSGRVVAGVCAAIANRYGWSANVVRLVFILSCLLPGPQFLIYIALWIFVPAEK